MNAEFIEVDQNLYEILIASGIEDAVQFSGNRIANEWASKGLELTPETDGTIGKMAIEEVEQLASTLRKFHLPADFANLFEIKSKKEALRLAEKTLTIHQTDFTNLVLDANVFGFDHNCKYIDFVPEGLKHFKPEDIGKTDPNTKLFSKEGKKAFNIITSAFEQRRMRTIHVFQSYSAWHCFFFDQNDFLGNHGDRWKGIPHIHYVSNLWGIPLDDLWNGFDSKDYSPSKAHIRYIRDTTKPPKK